MNETSSNFLERLASSLRELSSFGAEAKRPLVAVSGGIDSMVLMYALAQMRGIFPNGLIVGHVDHGLREDSASDAKFVKAQAEILGLPVFLKTLPEKPGGENLEAWARRFRYQALSEIKAEQGADLTFTAHHRDDQAETILFRLLTNRPPLPMPQFCSRRSLFRPFLGLSRADIVGYAKECSIQFSEDSSNSDLDRSRNWIRRSLLPEIRDNLNPRVAESLVGQGLAFSEMDLFLRTSAKDMLKAFNNQLTLEALGSISEPLKLFCLLELGKQQIGALIETVSRKKLANLESYINQDLGQGVRVCLDGEGKILFSSGNLA